METGNTGGGALARGVPFERIMLVCRHGMLVILCERRGDPPIPITVDLRDVSGIDLMPSDSRVVRRRGGHRVELLLPEPDLATMRHLTSALASGVEFGDAVASLS